MEKKNSFFMTYIFKGNQLGTSPHFDENMQGKSYSSGLNANTTIYSLRVQHVTCGN
jgi:hypothetical protein